MIRGCSRVPTRHVFRLIRNFVLFSNARNGTIARFAMPRRFFIARLFRRVVKFGLTKRSEVFDSALRI
jgi:hypothetical protein